MKDIGCFINLELPKGKELFKGIPDKDIIRLNSCRAAILHSIRCCGVKNVWIAKYQCDEVISFLTREGCEILFYDVDEKFNPILDSNGIDTSIVLSNYFGLFGDLHFIPLVNKFHNVIIDNAQALFYHPLVGCYNCYSPRKFVGSPDGAYVIGNNINRFHYERDMSSNTSQFLLMHYEYGCEGDAYDKKKENDARINASGIKLMSPLTRAILDSYDYAQVIQKRRENFQYARKLFDRINKFKLDEIVSDDAVPMGYPLWNEKAQIIPRFHENKIYQARYWEYLINTAPHDSLEYRWVKYMALICIDQRYGRNEIDFQLKVVQDCLSEKYGGGGITEQTLKLAEAIPEQYAIYYKFRCEGGDVFWNGYINPPDFEQMKSIYLTRCADADISAVGTKKIYFLKKMGSESDIFVGYILLSHNEDGFEIGYTISSDYFGNGFGTAAVDLVRGIAEKYSSDIYAMIRDDNLASQNVVKKNGFIKTGIIKEKTSPALGNMKLRMWKYCG